MSLKFDQIHTLSIADFTLYPVFHSIQKTTVLHLTIVYLMNGVLAIAGIAGILETHDLVLIEGLLNYIRNEGLD